MKSVITCDMEGRVLTMNDDAVKIFGYKKEEIIGKKRVSIFSPGEIVIQNVGNWLATADKLGEFVGKTYFLKKDGTKINAKISIRPTFADKIDNSLFRSDGIEYLYPLDWKSGDVQVFTGFVNENKTRLPENTGFSDLKLSDTDVSGGAGLRDYFIGPKQKELVQKAYRDFFIFLFTLLLKR